MDPAKPSLELVRSLTDEHVLRALMRHRRLTRAELAARDRHLQADRGGERAPPGRETGSVADTGERTPGGRGRGRVGSYYALAGDVGVALAVSIAPQGVTAECVDAYGDTVSRSDRPLARPARPRRRRRRTAGRRGRGTAQGTARRRPDPAAGRGERRRPGGPATPAG